MAGYSGTPLAKKLGIKAGSRVGLIFAPAPVREFRCDNRQVLYLDGIGGRLRSCSYAPGPEHPDHEPMMDELRRIFAACQRDGRIEIDYDCRGYYGRLG